MSENTKITCPDCGTKIDVNDILKHQLEDSIRKEFQQKQSELIAIQKEKEERLNEEKRKFEEQKQREQENIEEAIEKIIQKRPTIHKIPIQKKLF